MKNRTKNIFNRVIKALRPSKRIVVYTVLFTFIFQNMLAVCACAMQDIEVEVRHLPGRFSNLKNLKSIDGKLVASDGTDGFARTLPGFDVRIRQLDKTGTPEWETSQQFRKTGSGDLVAVTSSSKSVPSKIDALRLPSDHGYDVGTKAVALAPGHRGVTATSGLEPPRRVRSGTRFCESIRDGAYYAIAGLSDMTFRALGWTPMSTVTKDEESEGHIKERRAALASVPKLASVPNKGGVECSLSTEETPKFPLSFVLTPDGKVEVINLNESKTRFTIRSVEDVIFSGSKGAYASAGLKVVAPGLSVEQDFMTVALEAVMTGGPSSTGFKLAKGNQIHGLSRFMAYGSRFDNAGELSVYGGGKAHQSVIATDYFFNRATGVIDAQSIMDSTSILEVLSDHYVNEGKITAEKLIEKALSSYQQWGTVESSVSHGLGLSGKGHVTGSIKAKDFDLAGGSLSIGKDGLLDISTGSLAFDDLSVEGDLISEGKVDLSGRTMAVAGKLFSKGHQIKALIEENLNIAGLISAKLGGRLISLGRLDHTKTGLVASDGRINLDFEDGSLEGQYASLSKDAKGDFLEIAELFIRAHRTLAYNPERLRAARLLDITFDSIPDLKPGIRTNSALKIGVNAESGTLHLEQPIFAREGIDFEAVGVDVVYAGDKASFESDKDISVRSGSLDLKGKATSKGGAIKATVDKALNLKADVEAPTVHLKSGSLGFYPGAAGAAAAASSAGGAVVDETMPLVTATSDLGSDASLVLEADTMDLKSARLQSSGAISITNKDTADFRVPEHFKANGYHVDTQGNIIIESPIRPEGEYGLRLITPKTIRVGRKGHLVEVHTLRGPLELSAHLLDLKWAQLFSEQDMTLTSKTDIFLGEGVKETRKWFDSWPYSPQWVPYPYNNPNGSYLQTNHNLTLLFNNIMQNETGRIQVRGNIKIAAIDKSSLSELLLNRAGIICVDGDAKVSVKNLENTIFDIKRVSYRTSYYTYPKKERDFETSEASHIRVGGDLYVPPEFSPINTSSIFNLLGNYYVDGIKKEGLSGFFTNQTPTLLYRGWYNGGRWDVSSGFPKKARQIADIIIGREAVIPADSVINTGRFIAGGIATFRGHNFYSRNVDPQGIVAGIRVTFPELDSVLFKRNPDPTGPVMIPRAPLRLRSPLPINPGFVYIAPNVRFSAANPVRQYLSPEAMDHVLAMQLGASAELSALTPPQILAQLENNTQTFITAGHLALPAARPQALLMDEGVKETQLVGRNPMTSLSTLDPAIVTKPMIFWAIQMMDGIPTLKPVFLRRIDTTPTGHTSARRLELFYDNQIHLVGGTVQGREALRARVPRLTMEAAYYSTSRQIDNDTREDRHVPVRASAIGGEGDELGDFDVKVGETLMAGARSRGRGTFHSDGTRIMGAVETTAVTRDSRRSGPFGGRDVSKDVTQRHVPDLFEGELTIQGNDYVDMTGPHFEGRHQVSYPRGALRAPCDRHYHVQQSYQRGLVLDTASNRTSSSSIRKPAVTSNGTVGISIDDLLLEDSYERPMDMDGIDLAAANVVRRWQHDRHTYSSDTRHSLSAVAQIGTSIAFACMTGGMGASWSSAFLAGAARGATVAALSHTLNSAVSGQDPFTRDLVKAMVIQAVTQGATNSLLHRLNGVLSIPDGGSLADAQHIVFDPTTFAEHLQYAAIQTGVSSGVNWAVHGGKGSDILTQAGLSMAANTAGSYGASGIGTLYGGEEPIGYWVHKGLHAGLGAVTGALTSWDDPWIGAMSGAIGSSVGEIAMEAYAGHPRDRIVKIFDARNSSSTRAEKMAAYYNVGMEHAFSRMTAAAVTALAGGNPYIADATADNAIRNNFIPMLWASAGLISWATYEVEKRAIEAYDKGGVQAAANSVAVDGSLIALTGGIGNYAGSVARGVANKIPLSVRNQVTGQIERVWVSAAESSIGRTVTGWGQSAKERIASYGQNILGRLDTWKAAIPGTWGLSSAAAIGEGSAFASELYAARMMPKISGPTHKNSLQYVGDTHVYVMRGPDGALYKVGESARGIDKYGRSLRAREQLMRLRRKGHGDYRAKIIKEFGSKAEARDYETRFIKTYRKLYGKDKLPGNKGTR